MAAALAVNRTHSNGGSGGGKYGHLTAVYEKLQAGGISCTSKFSYFHSRPLGISAVDQIICDVAGHPGTMHYAGSELSLDFTAYPSPEVTRRASSLDETVLLDPPIEFYLVVGRDWIVNSSNAALAERVHGLLGGALYSPPSYVIAAARCVNSVQNVMQEEATAVQAAGSSTTAIDGALVDGVSKLGAGTTEALAFLDAFPTFFSTPPGDPFQTTVDACVRPADASPSPYVSPSPSPSPLPQDTSPSPLPDTPEAAADALHAAWQMDDRVAAMPVASTRAIGELFDAVGSWEPGYSRGNCDEYTPGFFQCPYRTVGGGFNFDMLVQSDTVGHWYVDSLFFGD